MFRLIFVLALMCCALACEKTKKVPPKVDPKPAIEEPHPLFQRSRPLMGTVFRIFVDAPAEKAQPAVTAAFDEIARLETILSEWRDDSEISRINASSGLTPVKVSDEVYAVVKAGLDVSRWSNGAFDLSWAALRGLYDFRPDHPRIPTATELEAKLPLIDWKQIVIDDDAQTVFLKKPGMAIGTGGIAKGYALDRAGALLQRRGIRNYMIFGGGQVQVHGKRGERAWRVGIQHPRDTANYFGSLESEGGSFSTSGDYEHVIIDNDGKRWHHIIDTKTGLPADKSLSVTVVASKGVYSDALSTAAFILGPAETLQMFNRIPVRAEVILVGQDCVLRTNELNKATLRANEDLGGKVADGKRLPKCEPVNTP